MEIASASAKNQLQYIRMLMAICVFWFLFFFLIYFLFVAFSQSTRVARRVSRSSNFAGVYEKPEQPEINSKVTLAKNNATQQQRRQQNRAHTHTHRRRHTCI